MYVVIVITASVGKKLAVITAIDSKITRLGHSVGEKGEIGNDVINPKIVAECMIITFFASMRRFVLKFLLCNTITCSKRQKGKSTQI
jgi:hypothetical protein